MPRFAKQIVFWSALALFPATAQGQWIDDYEGVLNSQEELVFQGGSGVNSNFVVQNDLLNSRVQVGPYRGAFNQGGALTPSFSLVCVDYEAYAGSQRVNVTSVAGSDFGNTLLGSTSGSAGRYRQAAYYASLFDSWQDYGSNRSQVWSALHATIWSVMSGDDVVSGNSSLQAQIVLANANAANGYSGDGWYVLSAVDSPRRQEMLIRTPATSVPEPSSYLLMATGLLFLAVLGRRRKESVGVA